MRALRLPNEHNHQHLSLPHAPSNHKPGTAESQQRLRIARVCLKSADLRLEPSYVRFHCVPTEVSVRLIEVTVRAVNTQCCFFFIKE